MGSFRSFLLSAVVATVAIAMILGYGTRLTVQRVRRVVGLSGGRAHRADAAEAQSRWTTRLCWIVCRLLAVRPEFLRPAENGSSLAGRSFLVVSNHRSTMDIALLYAYLRELGQTDLRWLIKEEARRYPVIGAAAKEIGCAFLARGKRGQGSRVRDIRRIMACAALADGDRASILLFPEGTRFRAPKDGSAFRHVLKPKTSGFAAVRQAFDAPVLSVTIRWSGGAGGGRTMFGAGAFVGRRVTVRSRIVPVAEVGDAAEWLMEEWRRKDQALAAAE